MILPEYWMVIRCVTCGEVWDSQRIRQPEEATEYAEPIIYKHQHKDTSPQKVSTVFSDPHRL